jgi:hypothetical protein
MSSGGAGGAPAAISQTYEERLNSPLAPAFSAVGFISDTPYDARAPARLFDAPSVASDVSAAAAAAVPPTLDAKQDAARDPTGLPSHTFRESLDLTIGDRVSFQREPSLVWISSFAHLAWRSDDLICGCRSLSVGGDFSSVSLVLRVSLWDLLASVSVFTGSESALSNRRHVHSP